MAAVDLDNQAALDSSAIDWVTALAIHIAIKRILCMRSSALQFISFMLIAGAALTLVLYDFGMYSRHIARNVYLPLTLVITTNQSVCSSASSQCRNGWQSCRMNSLLGPVGPFRRFYFSLYVLQEVESRMLTVSLRTESLQWAIRYTHAHHRWVIPLFHTWLLC
jgi:hypothetical protein